ncbi:hypothetical protein V5F77_24020 [Xanthobacter sp. DSM 24535]|uniref:hypothetical protein n=1 Tax=Roseixanthobacter psychrophilus TaxID=3119917 RepID=UPI0037263FAC
MRHLTRAEIWLIRTEQEARYARERETLRPKEKLRRKLKPGLRNRMIDILVPILRRAEPTAFAIEGVMRSNIRSRLCLKGWGWRDADNASEDVLEAALNRIGAVRPAWKQGQPEWTQDGVVHVPRTRCVNCGKTLPEENYKYCGPICAKSSIDYNYRRFRELELESIKALSDAEN